MHDRRWWALGVLCLSLLVVGIDTHILNVAIPTLVRELDATPSELQWIIDSYVLLFAGLLLTGGKLADRYGRRGVMTVGLVVFGAASVAAATSSSPAQLVLWRGVMGVGAALIMPATLSILVNLFTDERERRRAIAYWSLMNAASAFVGPVTGGLLLRHFSWTACFLVNVPVVVAALALGRWLVPTSRDPYAARRFDVTGAALSTSGLGALLFGVIEGPGRGWTDATVVGAFAGAAALLVAFVAWELRVADPMLDLSALASPQLRAAATAMTVSFMAMSSSMFLIVQSLQLVKDYTPLAAALATSGPIVTMNFLVMPRTPGLTERFGTRRVVAAGSTLIACAALVISTTTVDSGYANLGVGFALMALAFSIFVPASTEAVMTAVPAERSGGASAITQMTRQLGQALGVAVGGSIAASGYRRDFSLPEGLVPDGLAARAGDSITGALDAAGDLPAAAADAVLAAAHEAFLSGVRVSLFAAAVLAVGAAVFAARAIPDRAGTRSRADRDEEPVSR